VTALKELLDKLRIEHERLQQSRAKTVLDPVDTLELEAAVAELVGYLKQHEEEEAPSPVPVGLGTEVRVKLDFVMVVPGDGIPHGVNPMDLIVDGITAARIASEIKPGLRCDMRLTPASSRRLRTAAKAKR
jgi:hypothetical protein